MSSQELDSMVMSERVLSDFDKKKIELEGKYDSIISSLLTSEEIFASKLELELSSQSDVSIRIRKSLTREIDFGYTHQKWIIDIKGLVSSDELSLIEKDNRVIAIKQKRKADSSFDIIDLMSLNDLVKKHIGLYGKSNLSREEFFPLKIFLYGHSCSFGGEPPKKSIEMMSLVKTKDKGGLLNWLRAMNPELQTYAIEGLFYLQEMGVELNEREESLYEYVRDKERNILKCEGCIYNIVRSTKDELNKKRLKKRYKKIKRMKN